MSKVMVRESRGKGIYMNPIERDTMSVCSCTCVPRARTKRRPESGGLWSRLMWRLGMGGEDRNSDNYYDSETQSISNYTKLAVKRSSF